MPQNNPLPNLPSTSEIANSRQSFVEYVRERRSQPPLGRVIERLRTLINAGCAPTAITTWFELFRWVDRERFSRDDIGHVRQLWHQYLAKHPRPNRLAEVPLRKIEGTLQ